MRAEKQRHARHHEEQQTLNDLLVLTHEITHEEHLRVDAGRGEVGATRRVLAALVLLAFVVALGLVIAFAWTAATSLTRRRQALEENARLEQLVEAQDTREETIHSREQFIGVLGHDLRNPLAAIKMAAGLLQRQDLAVGEARAANVIRDSTDRMVRMIDQLLDLSRIRNDAGIPVEPRPMDLANVARQVANEIALARPERQLKLTREGETTGEWDPDRLAQVVSNLVGNAIDHGAVGKPIEVRVAADGPTAVRLTVHNEGAAIPAALVPVIFDRFQRGTATRRSGLGLGLFITKTIVLAHGGKITLESTSDAGTTVSVRLPCRHPMVESA
jgi:signal transduction histidine kinase